MTIVNWFRRHVAAGVVVALCLTTTGFADESLRRSAVVEAVERTSPAVVSVLTTVVVRERTSPFSWFFEDFAPHRRRLETASNGSGVIIAASGLVLTNYHVIEAGRDIHVELADGRRLPAKVVGTSPDHDLAVLRVDAEQTLPHVPMGSSRNLMIGETVIAIGNPFGLSHTVTTGVISAVNRTIRADERIYTDFIQTDASINPGNSGGPLLTIDGQLIGVNTAIYGKAQGIGFAIPIDKAERIVEDLVEFGEVRRPYYGFDVQPLTRDLASNLDVPGRAGVVVTEVDQSGPAASVLEPGDVLVAIGRVRIENPTILRTRLGDFTVGDSVAFKLYRDGQKRTVTLEPVRLSPKEALRRVREKIGLEVRSVSKQQAARSQLPAGLIVVESVQRGSPAHRVGIRPGDWIRAVNSEKVLGREDFGKAMARSYWRGKVTLLIQRGRGWQQIPFEF